MCNRNHLAVKDLAGVHADLDNALLDAIRAEINVSKKEAKIGVIDSPEAPYAVELEMGIGVAPRPFIRPGFLNNLKRARQILGSKITGKLEVSGGASGHVKNFTKEIR